MVSFGQKQLLISFERPWSWAKSPQARQDSTTSSSQTQLAYHDLSHHFNLLRCILIYRWVMTSVQTNTSIGAYGTEENIVFSQELLHIYSPRCLGQEITKKPFGLRVKMPPV